MAAKIIFVLSKGRTGSTLLCKLLTHYKNVINFNEALTSESSDLFYTDLKFLCVLYEKFGIRYEDELKLKFFDEPIQIISTISDYYTEDTIVLKLHLSELRILEDENMDWILSQPNHRFILLERADYLQTYVSEEIARQEDAWHDEDTSDIKIKIDVPEFLRQFRVNMNQFNRIKTKLNYYDTDYLSFEYDKDLKNYNKDDFFNLVDPWVKRTGLDLQFGDPPIITTKKQNSNEDIFDNIINHEEIREVVKNLDKLYAIMIKNRSI